MTKVIRIELEARQQQMSITKVNEGFNPVTIALGVLSMFCIIAYIAA